LTAPRLRFVDDVIVDEGGCMHHLDDGRHGDGRLVRFAEQLAGEQDERGPQPLAAAFLQVAIDGGHRVDRRDRLQAHLLFDTPQVRFDKLEDLAGC
jgi:hypothetical protein